MKNSTTLNKQVAITALSFRSKNGLVGFPKRMEFDGQTYAFQSGLQCLIKKGQQIVRIFDMTDGNDTFRLRCDEAQRDWTLIAISAGGE